MLGNEMVGLGAPGLAASLLDHCQLSASGVEVEIYLVHELAREIEAQSPLHSMRSNNQPLSWRRSLSIE